MLASRCMINLHVEQVSDTPSERRRTLPVSKHFRQVRIYEKEQAAFVSKQATYRLSVHKYTGTATNKAIYRHSHEQGVPAMFDSQVFKFLPQGYHHSSQPRIPTRQARSYVHLPPYFKAVVVSPSWQNRLGFVACN